MEEETKLKTERMIKLVLQASDLLHITNKAKEFDKLERWWNLSEDIVNELLLKQAKLGRHYLTLGPSHVKWLSVPEFRYLVMFKLNEHGYLVEDVGNNSLSIKWN